MFTISCSSTQLNSIPENISSNRDIASASDEVHMSSLSINKAALIVTHAHRYYDYNEKAKQAIDRWCRKSCVN